MNLNLSEVRPAEADEQRRAPAREQARAEGERGGGPLERTPLTHTSSMSPWSATSHCDGCPTTSRLTSTAGVWAAGAESSDLRRCACARLTMGWAISRTAPRGSTRKDEPEGHAVVTDLQPPATRGGLSPMTSSRSHCCKSDASSAGYVSGSGSPNNTMSAAGSQLCDPTRQQRTGCTHLASARGARPPLQGAAGATTPVGAVTGGQGTSGDRVCMGAPRRQLCTWSAGSEALARLRLAPDAARVVRTEPPVSPLQRCVSAVSAGASSASCCCWASERPLHSGHRGTAPPTVAPDPCASSTCAAGPNGCDRRHCDVGNAQISVSMRRCTCMHATTP